MFTADLHIHSRYSRATSGLSEPINLHLAARRKGISLIATGDFTHSAYRKELAEKLLPAEEGLYRLKPELALADELHIEAAEPRFILSGEISSIYKDKGRTRKIHNVILLPHLQAAEELSRRLENAGCNLRSDGRPIIGISAHDLLEMTLDVCDQAIFIPAHIWTPHFSLFGAYSGYDTIEDCFEDLTPYIHALETGLSSDPQMNRRVSALDKYNLVSNSDAHSPGNLAREANLFDCPMDYTSIAAALADHEGRALAGTIEFFPELGKYHWDGHRDCKYSCRPSLAIKQAGICPVCGGKLIYGVEHRVEELADRPEDFIMEQDRPYYRLAPLAETIASCMGMTTASKKVAAQYEKLLAELGTELDILLHVPLADIKEAGNDILALGIQRLREGKAELSAGYDGAYGKIQLFTKEELDELQGQTALFHIQGKADNGDEGSPVKSRPVKSRSIGSGQAASGAELNPEQMQAITAADRHIAVLAGPGTGKTHTLICRILHLLEQGIAPESIMAVTFTNKAAGELLSRLKAKVGSKTAKKVLAGTFHSLALSFLRAHKTAPIIADEFALEALAEEYLAEHPQEKLTAEKFLHQLAKEKNSGEKTLSPLLVAGWQEKLAGLNACDFDDLLTAAYELTQTHPLPAGMYLLADEFQDIDPLQIRLLEAWNKDAASLFIIGDPAQAIYGFRGAAATCFDDFFALHPDTRIITLKENYRSSNNILAAALPLLGEEAPPLQAHRISQIPVRLIETQSPMSEGIFIAEEIDKLVGGIDMLRAHRRGAEDTDHRSLSEIAVLYRTHKQAETIAACLDTAGIPYTVSGREDYLQAETVRLCLSFFRSLEQDENSLPALICQHLLSTDKYKELREKFLALPARTKAEEFIDRWIELNYLTGNEDMEKLRNAAVQAGDMSALLAGELSGLDGDMQRSGSRQRQSSAVSLMTLHAAKGLEFPVVFVAGLQEGLLPLRMKGLPCDEQEEKRLFYVGMTRAAEELLLLSREENSHFLNLIPTQLLHKEKTTYRRKVKIDQLSLF